MSMNDPELSRLSNKAIYGNYLEVHRRRQQLVWIFFWESCGECESGGFVKNILADVTAVRVGVEYDGFTPDICLDRNNKPPVWIEFSPPMVEKVAYCAAHHIDLVELAGQHPSELSVERAHISPRNCCARERKRLRDLWEGLKDLPDPLVGIREDFRSPRRKQREFDEFWAEVPALQGCMAWGDNPEQTLDELRAVAKALIQSRQERGVPLPPEVTPQRTGKGSFTVVTKMEPRS